MAIELKAEEGMEMGFSLMHFGILHNINTSENTTISLNI